MADPEDPPAEPLPCSACRGTGQVISTKGGEPSVVTCPWCEGTKVALGPEHDAQAHWAGNGDDAA